MLKYNHSLTKKWLNKQASDEDLLRWLLMLLNLDIDELSKKECQELKKALSKQDALIRQDLKETLEEFNNGMKSFIPTDGSHGEWEFDIHPGKIMVVREPYYEPSNNLFPITRKFSTGDSRTKFFLRFADILHQFGLRLERCKECNSVFFRSKTDQEYCSNQCAIRVRQRRFYAAHKEEIKKKRRKNYEQTTQEKDTKHGKKRR